jgi:N4-gp56 family major capsid protein
MSNPHAILGLAATDTGDVADQIPADVYSSRVLEALYAARKLAGIVSAVREDMTAMAGTTIQVPYMNRRTAQGPIAEGVALTDTATTTGTYPVTLAKYGDYDLVNREVFEDQDNFTQEDFIRNMGEALAEKVDDLVFTALEGAATTNVQDLAVAGTLTDLYDKVVDLKAMMKKDNVNPTHIIIGPDQEAQFLKDTSEGIKFTSITVQDGELLRVAGLEVIVTSLANAKAATAGLVQAIVIDQRRALVEAWGRRPTTTVDATSKAESDQVKLVTWIRYGVAAMELNSIGHVRNAP